MHTLRDGNQTGTQTTSKLVGRWLYGAKPLEYQITQAPDGRLRFVGPHVGGKVSGWLQQEDKWWQAELADRNGDIVGEIRLCLENDLVVSNFKGRTSPEWGRNIVAQAPAPKSSLQPCQAPQEVQESICLVAECRGWDATQTEMQFKQQWYDPFEKCMRQELFIQLGSAKANKTPANPCELFAALSFQIISVKQAWQWRLFPAQAPEEGAQKWGCENILVPSKAKAVRVRMGSSEGHGRMFHILEEQGTKVTICVSLPVRVGKASPSVWYEKRGIGKPVIVQNRHGTMREQIACAYGVRGADFDEVWSTASKKVSTSGAISLMVLDQVQNSDTLPSECFPATQGPRSCREALCLVAGFSGWSPNNPQNHFQQCWFDRKANAVRHELCLWMGTPGRHSATEWQDVFVTLTFQIISAALDKTWKWRLYPAFPATAIWRKENVLLPGRKDAVQVEHGEDGHGRNFSIAERYGTTITICVELSDLGGCLCPHVWYEKRGTDAQSYGRDEDIPSRARLRLAYKLRGVDFSEEWDSAMGQALCPRWWQNASARKKALMKAESTKQKAETMASSTDEPVSYVAPRQFSKKEARESFAHLQAEFSRQEVFDILVESCRVTDVLPHADETFPFLTQAARELIDQIVRGLLLRHGFSEYYEFTEAFVSLWGDEDVARDVKLFAETTVNMQKAARKPRPKPETTRKNAIAVRSNDSAIVAACGSQLQVGDEVMIRWQANAHGARYLTYLNGHTAKLLQFEISEDKWRVGLITYDGEFSIASRNLHKVEAKAAVQVDSHIRNNAKASSTSSTECTMCFGSFLESQLIVLGCTESHRFCHQCIRKWVRSNLVPRCYACLDEDRNLLGSSSGAWESIVQDEDAATNTYRITESDIDKCEFLCEFRVHSGAECLIIGAKNLIGMRGTIGRVTKNPGGRFSAVVYLHKDGSHYELPQTCLELDDCLSSGRLAAGKPCPAKGIRFGQSLQLASLGCACPVKQAMDELYVQQLAMPFDWLVSRVEGVLYFFRHGFRDFCHYDDVRKVGRHGFTSFRSSYHAFPHHDLKANGAKSAFIRRATRLLQLVKSAAEGRATRPVLLIRIVASTRELTQSEELYALLRLMGGQRIFLLVIISEQRSGLHVGAARHHVHKNLIFFVLGLKDSFETAVKFGMHYAYGIMHRGEAVLDTVTRKVCPLSPVQHSGDLAKVLDFHQHWLTKDPNGLMPTSDITDCVNDRYEHPHAFFPGRFHLSGTFEASPYFSKTLAALVKAGNVEEIKSIIANGGIDLNAWNAQGETVLFGGIACRNIHVCACLLLASADPNCQARDGSRAVDRLPTSESCVCRNTMPANGEHLDKITALRLLLSAAAGELVQNEDLVIALCLVPEPERRQLCAVLGVMTFPEVAPQKKKSIPIPKSCQILFTEHFLTDAENRGEDYVAALRSLRLEASSDARRRQLVMRLLLRDWHPDKHSNAAVDEQNHAAAVFCYIQGLKALFLQSG